MAPDRQSTPWNRAPMCPVQVSYQICLEVVKQRSGATSTTPVVLAAGEGRQFTSPGYDGSTGYGNQAKCVWTFAPATGATLTFSCSAFDLTATSAVGDKCTGLAIFVST